MGVPEMSEGSGIQLIEEEVKQKDPDPSEARERELIKKKIADFESIRRTMELSSLQKTQKQREMEKTSFMKVLYANLRKSHAGIEEEGKQVKDLFQ